MKRRSFLTILGAALTPGIPATAKPAAVTKSVVRVASFDPLAYTGDFQWVNTTTIGVRYFDKGTTPTP